MYEPKVNNPLKLNIDLNVIELNGEVKSLKNNLLLNGEHYGFYLVNGSEVLYKTQERIVGVQVVDEFLYVYEDNKFIPWSFNKDTGELLNEAIFSDYKKTERTYLKEEYGIVDNDDLMEINNRKK